MDSFAEGLASGGTDTTADAYTSLRETLADISRSRAIQGFTPTDTASFMFSLKEPIFDALSRVSGADAAQVTAGTWSVSKVIDQLGLHTMEVFQQSREEVIGRQSGGDR